MAFTFIPIKDDCVLQKLRNKLPKFMQNIRKCFVTGEISSCEREEICNQVIKTASSDFHPELRDGIEKFICQTSANTLNLEHQAIRKLNRR